MWWTTLLQSPQKISKINYFAVGDLTEFSDHCPISFNLSYINQENDKTVEFVDQIIWDIDKCDQFTASINEKETYLKYC